MSGVAHFFMVVGGSNIHERLAHFFIDIYKLVGVDIYFTGVGLVDLATIKEMLAIAESSRS